MCDIECPYKVNNECGYNDTCIGCSNDPQNRPLSYEDFMDMRCNLNCSDCKHWKNCKRLDHKHYSFAKPIFKIYDSDCGHICSDFEPNEWQLWLYRHWQPSYINDYRNNIDDDMTIKLCIDGDYEKRYHINYLQFFDNNFKNKDDSLKWLKVGYYKRTKQNEIGYTYIYEYPDGMKINSMGRVIQYDNK